MSSNQMRVEPPSVGLNIGYNTSETLGDDQVTRHRSDIISDAPSILESERDTNRVDGSAVSNNESKFVDICTPEPRINEDYSQLSNIEHAPECQHTSVRPSSQLPHLKRGAGIDADIVLPKRVKTQEMESPSRQSAVPTGAEDENLRENHEAKQRFLEEKIMNLEAQLQKIREHEGQQGTELAVIEGPIRGPTQVPEASSSHHERHDIKVLTRSLIDMSAEKSELRDALRAKEESLSTISKQLDDKKEELCNKDVELKEAEHQVTAMAGDLREQKQLCRIAKQERQALELEKDGIGKKLKETKGRLAALERHHQNVSNQDRVSLEKLKKQAKIDQKIIQSLRDMSATREKKLTLQDTTMKMLENSLSAVNKEAKEAEAKVEKIQAELHIEQVKVDELVAKNQDLAAEAAGIEGWKERLQDMFSAYEDVRAKNTTLIDKVEQVLQVGTFGDISAKNRRTLEKLKSCPVEELAAYYAM